jgi:imidazolonepropionase
VDLVVTGISEALTCAGGAGPLVGPAMKSPDRVTHAALIAASGVIEWVGPGSELSTRLAGRTPRTVLDAAGGVVTPAYVDCHTHIPFAGGREGEFEMRIEGKTYLEIAAAGGGIATSVRQFRETSREVLIERNAKRLEAMLAGGSVTIECKTGYGLSVEAELMGLEILRELDERGPWRLVPTFLGAHTIPPEARSNRSAYVDLLVDEMIPRVAEQGIARFCDVFIEEGAFSVAEARRILEAARGHGLAAKLHVDEFHSLGGTALAAELRAISADHLDVVHPEEAARLAEEGVVAVLMPGVNYFLGSRSYAPARMLIDAGVPVALATDFNPGSCMCHSMEMILSLACTQLRLLPLEALVAATRNAAYACGLGEEVGRLEPGFAADLIVHTAGDLRTLPYHFGSTHVRHVCAAGRIVPAPAPA